MTRWKSSDLAPKSAPVERTGTGKGKTTAEPKERRTREQIEAEELADPKILAARRQVVGYARRADTNTTFGCPVYVRAYRVLHEAEAARLDACFDEITNPYKE